MGTRKINSGYFRSCNQRTTHMRTKTNSVLLLLEQIKLYLYPNTLEIFEKKRTKIFNLNDELPCTLPTKYSIHIIKILATRASN